LHFVNRNEFTLAGTDLSDTLCDGRTAIADVETQDGYLAEFTNPQGCGTDATFWGPIYFTHSAGIHYVYIRLYACNTHGCSSPQNSLKHYNPYW
jgi:hypothetical protein